MTFILSSILIINFVLSSGLKDNKTAAWAIVNKLQFTRRVLNGNEVRDTRPYMVYLRRVTNNNTNEEVDKNWMCGGAIIHEHYILTSAACIEDAKQFYVISGTFKYIAPEEESDCVKNGAKKAVWKCVPKSYVYDGNEFDNIRWMMDDIAVVKVEDPFNFHRKIKGCDFIPKLIAYNNVSVDFEKPGTLGSLSGWGSVDSFGDTDLKNSENSPNLLETDVTTISLKKCKKIWGERYHHAIDTNMICSRDNMDADAMSKACSEQQVNCEELIHSQELDDDARRQIETAAAAARSRNDTRRSKGQGGFCENDHGGPLIVGRGTTAMIIGTITASLTGPNKKCRGPYLYTSVWKNRHLINCAIFKEMGATCRKYLRTSNFQILETHFEWPTSTSSSNTPKTTTSMLETSMGRRRSTTKYSYHPRTYGKRSHH